MRTYLQICLKEVRKRKVKKKKAVVTSSGEKDKDLKTTLQNSS